MKMVTSVAIGFLLTLNLCGAAFAQSANEDLVTLFGENPGTGKAMACFSRVYDKAHLASHGQQNVTRMLAFVSKDEGQDQYFGVNLQVGFRHLDQPFDVAGSCSLDASGSKTLSCGIDCDGGQLDVRVRDNQSILIDIPESVRIYDASAAEDTDEELPKHARFGSDDKVFRLDRTDLKDCVGIIYDEETKAQITGQSTPSQ